MNVRVVVKACFYVGLGCQLCGAGHTHAQLTDLPLTAGRDGAWKVGLMAFLVKVCCAPSIL